MCLSRNTTKHTVNGDVQMLSHDSSGSEVDDNVGDHDYELSLYNESSLAHDDKTSDTASGSDDAPTDGGDAAIIVVLVMLCLQLVMMMPLRDSMVCLNTLINN